MLESLLYVQQSNRPIPTGQVLFDDRTTHTFIVPPGFNRLSILAIAAGYRAGGGLSYRNNVPVTTGEILFVTVGGESLTDLDSFVTREDGTLLAIAKGPVGYAGGLGGKAASSINTGGGNGGNYFIHGCGGAGGYSGNGGDGCATQNAAGKPGQGGGGGGGGHSLVGNRNIWGPGGGTWPYGEGVSGVAGVTVTSNTNAVWGGQGSRNSNGRIKDYQYGGGVHSLNSLRACVRLIWSSSITRAFPSTNTHDM